MPYPPQIRALSRAVDIVVATPGRLLDLLSNRRLDLSMIETVVLDEADRMLDMGFIEDVSKIVKLTPVTRQILLFSATVDGKLAKLAEELIKAPIRIDLTPQNVTPSSIKQAVYMSDHPEHKNKMLYHLLQHGNIFKAIIFSATKINADTLASNLRKQGYAVAALHSDLKQNARERTLRQLRTGQIQLLVATDIAARGIDISDISHVINYDLPRTAEDYVHRIGRAGRAGRDGTALTFALFSEISKLKRIEYSTKQQINREIVPGLAPVSKPKSDAVRKKHKKQAQKKANASPKRFYQAKPGQGAKPGTNQNSGGKKQVHRKPINKAKRDDR
jgi:superfamily II DNA/RNA helicase